MKRLMCAAMAGITALTSIVMTVPAAAEEKTNRYGDFEYKINGSEVAITKYVGDDSSVYIPDYIDGRKVTEIGEGAFALLDEHNEAIENEKLTHVRLPAYLESIGREAFYHTTSLESIVLPASLKEVGYFAFEGSGISELVIGSDLKLADNSFAECVNLSTVSLYPNTTWYTNYYTGTPFRSTTGMSDVYYLGNGKESDFVGYFAVGYPSTIGDANFYAFNEFEYYGVSVQKFDPHDTHALVTFNTNGGDTANTQIYALKGQMVSEAIPPEKKDCEFVGWYDNKACTHLYHTFLRLMEQIRNREFTPNIVYRGEEPVEYGVFPYQQFGSEYRSEIFDSVSVMLETYYATKSLLTRIHQKSSDLRRVVQTALERNRKKYNIQKKQLNDTAKKDKFKVYGELINTYGYGLEEGCKSFKALNYYTNEEITIPLDPTLTPAQNSKKYFDKYGKLKRTEEAVTQQIADTESEISHLESISNALDIARSESDLSQIKEELTEYGYIKRHYTNKKGQKAQPKSKPLHYISSDGFDIYVGKNNFQNDELTFKFATGNDWWFHAKKMAGSHVVVRTKDGELPDRTFEEAGRLAAWYSKGHSAPKVEIDYIQKKHVKKPAGAKPGFVVYYTNYSLMASPDISDLKEVTE